MSKLRFLLLAACLAPIGAGAQVSAPARGGPYVDRSAPPPAPVTAKSVLDLPLPSPDAFPAAHNNAGLANSTLGGLPEQLELAAMSASGALLRYPSANTVNSGGGQATLQGGGSTARVYKSVRVRNDEVIFIEGRKYVVKLGDESVQLFAVGQKKPGELMWVGYLSGPELITAKPNSGDASFKPPLSAGADFSKSGGGGSGSGAGSTSPVQTEPRDGATQSR
jgi:hypothetical protein